MAHPDVRGNHHFTFVLEPRTTEMVIPLSPDQAWRMVIPPMWASPQIMISTVSELKASEMFFLRGPVNHHLSSFQLFGAHVAHQGRRNPKPPALQGIMPAASQSGVSGGMMMIRVGALQCPIKRWTSFVGQPTTRTAMWSRRNGQVGFGARSRQDGDSCATIFLRLFVWGCGLQVEGWGS